MKYLFYSVVGWCLVCGLFSSVSAQNRFTTKGKLLLCDVDAAQISLLGRQSTEHYRHWSWCQGFVDGVIETMKEEGCRFERVVLPLPVIDLAQKIMIRADTGGPDAEKALQGLGGFPPAKAVAQALYTLRDSPEWACDEGNEP